MRSLCDAPQDERELLALVQRETFEYFRHEVNPANGLIADKSRADWPCSIAATGLALATYPVAVESGLMTRDAAAARTRTTLRFFAESRQGTEPDATGYKGFYYHWLDMFTGRRAWGCELSTVDTAFLLAGGLAAATYFDAENDVEHDIRTLARELYCRADWQWAQNGAATLTHGWKPETGFLPFRWEGYDEALLLYVLGLGSPTHPLPEESYRAFTSTYEWKTIYGSELLYAGPLFIHQLSYTWIDVRGIQDAPMRERGFDYFENSRRATYVQQQYAIRNPRQFESYGELCWGFTASDGPGPARWRINGVEREFSDYVARGVPDGPEDGTLAPWAVIASLPFAPEIVLPTIRHFIEHFELGQSDRYGFEATFNPTYPTDRAQRCGWVSPWNFGIDQGPIVLMIANYRSEFLWRLIRRCPAFVQGLRRAGFTGGWIDEPSP